MCKYRPVSMIKYFLLHLQLNLAKKNPYFQKNLFYSVNCITLYTCIVYVETTVKMELHFNIVFLLLTMY